MTPPKLFQNFGFHDFQLNSVTVYGMLVMKNGRCYFFSYRCQ